MDYGKHHKINKRINRFMKQKGFKQCRSDINIYVQTKEGQAVYLVLYVNNLSIFNKSFDEVKKVKLALLKEFEVKDLGEIGFYLRIWIIKDQTNKMINFSQVEYIIKILQRFRMEKLKPLRTPLDINVQLTKGQVPIIQTRKLLKWKRYHIVRQPLVASCIPWLQLD